MLATRQSTAQAQAEPAGFRGALPMDDLKVCNRIDAILHMRDLRVLKPSADVEDAVHGCDVGQEVVAQALALSSSPAMALHLSCLGQLTLGLGQPSNDVC